VRWFGEPWPSAEMRASVCEDDALRVPTPPAGERCPLCGKGFSSAHRGVLLPTIEADGSYSIRPAHLACIVESVGGQEPP
jgi:hypothetical protein